MVSSKFKTMLSELSTVKVKGKHSTVGQASHLATYQGDIIRKSICNGPKVPLSLLREKSQANDS